MATKAPELAAPRDGRRAAAGLRCQGASERARRVLEPWGKARAHDAIPRREAPSGERPARGRRKRRRVRGLPDPPHDAVAGSPDSTARAPRRPLRLPFRTAHGPTPRTQPRVPYATDPPSRGRRRFRRRAAQRARRPRDVQGLASSRSVSRGPGRETLQSAVSRESISTPLVFKQENNVAPIQSRAMVFCPSPR